MWKGQKKTLSCLIFSNPIGVLEDNSPFVIPPKPKPIPFFVTSSSGNKVEPNFDFNQKNDNPIV